MSDEFRAALDDYMRRPAPNLNLSGRGIVICAGGERLFTSAYVLLRVLRETLGCTLPIQLWHFGGEELSPAMRALLVPLNVELVDATAFLEDYPADIGNGWQLKSYALLQSRFAEVLMLDADQVPVRDPALVFEMPEYLQTGAVFWPDIIDLSAANPIWALTGLAAENCPAWESGQIVVDKRRHLRALRIALYLNERAGVVYRMLYGDKDTFLIAWRIAGASVAVVPHRPFIDERVLVQRDFAGAPLFQHRTGSKWNYHTNQYRLDGFQHMESCLAFLADLRASWNGRIFFPPDRSLAARMEEDRLVGVCHTRLAILGDSELELELLPGHQIGKGRSYERQNWYVAETETGLELLIEGADQIAYRLGQGRGGVWLGDRLCIPQSEVRLEEQAGSAATQPVAGKNSLIEVIIEVSGVASGAGAVARERLANTLLLLLRAQPGLRDALDRAAGRSAEITGVVADVFAREAQNHGERIGSALEVVHEGYHMPAGPSP
jgi:hypothetical protein